MRDIYIVPFQNFYFYALMNGTEILDCFLTTRDGVSDVGAIYIAKCERNIKGMGGIFVDLGTQKAFLRTKKNYAEGKEIAVQIVQYASDEKPARVSDQIDYRGIYTVLTPGRVGVNQSRKATTSILTEDQIGDIRKILPEDCGLIIRSEAEFAKFDQILDEIKKLVDQLNIVTQGKKSGLVVPAEIKTSRALMEWGYGKIQFMEAFPEILKEALFSNVRTPIQLSSGGTVYVEKTRAAVTVDVNTKSNLSAQAQRNVNREAVEVILDALNMMGLGGQLLVDFAPMPQSAQKNVGERFVKLARQKRLQVNFRGFGPLGLLEATISHKRLPLPKRFLEQMENL